MMILVLLLGLGGPLGWGLLGAWAQAPGARFSDVHSPRPLGVWGAEAEDSSGDPIRRNWCPYQKSRLVTFVATCKMEKFLVHSQQPCPQEAPDCQRVKVMYRVAHRPVYQVRQKVLVSVAWRCCPGFEGPNCQHHDPTVTPEPAEPSGGVQEPWDELAGFELGHPAAELSEVERQQDQQEHLLGEVQNDVRQATEGLPGLWKALASNLTAAGTDNDQTELEFPGRSLEPTLLPHMDTFLRGLVGPIWRSFNESLHSLSRAVRNLTLDVEANRQAIKSVQEDTVARADFQELGSKFEAKVQESSQRGEQLWQEVEGRLHTQHSSLQQALAEVQADVDTKLKRLLRAPEAPVANGSLAVASAARPEPESLQARLGQLQRNLSALHAARNLREEELQRTLGDMRAVLAQHADEIKELYSESDDTFDQISKVERQVEELRVNRTALRELRVALMEKSLVMEENKEETERQLLELNLTLQHLQGGHADLFRYVKDCNCQKLRFELDALREGQTDAARALAETQASPGAPDDPSLEALGRALDAVSLAVDAHREEGVRARAERARLRSQLQALGRAVEALEAAAGQMRRETRQLHGQFAALLEDALRHEAVLAALFGEEVMEEMSASEGAPSQLPLRYEQIRVGLQDAASGLREQALGWAELAARVEALEQAAGGHTERPRPAGPPEPGHDPGQAEATAAALAGLELALQRLSSDVSRAGRCCEASGAVALNGSLEGLRSELSATERGLQQHRQLFHSLFGNFQGLVTANVSLDLDKLQAMLSRKGKKQKGLATPRKRDKKQVTLWADANVKGLDQDALGPELLEAGSPVAFYASYSEGTAALQTVKFNTTSINVGSSYFPEHGSFRAPKRGVYLFAVSIDFGPGPGMGQLVFGGHHRTPVYSTEQSSGSTTTAFAMAELQKGERVWFELTQGSVRKRRPPGTAFGGFLLFRT